MVFANRCYKFSRLLWITLASVVLISCATQEIQQNVPQKKKIKLEPRSSLLLWHDMTHKSYFGLKGPVKSLVLRPVVLLEDSSQAVSDQWQFEFNNQGRLLSKTRQDGTDFKTLYSYNEQGLLAHVASYNGGKLWRSRIFVYENGELVKIQYVDKKSNEQIFTKVSRQIIPGGWFEIQKPVTTPGIPVYTQFLKDGTLIWNNRGDINNGLGELYYIRTVDGVTSSSVADKGTVHMRGIGGYRYFYNEDGLLRAVESYNANANRLFHRTSYEYDELGLLKSEQREVTDISNFNEAVNENVKYSYEAVDQYGNWLSRKLTTKSGFQTQVYSESRNIEYYSNFPHDHAPL